MGRMEATAVSSDWVNNFEVESAAAIAEITSHNACCLFPNDRQKLFRVWNTANKNFSDRKFGKMRSLFISKRGTYQKYCERHSW